MAVQDAKDVLVCFLLLRQMDTMTKISLGAKGLFLLTSYSLSPREAKAGAQGRN